MPLVWPLTPQPADDRIQEGTYILEELAGRAFSHPAADGYIMGTRDNDVATSTVGGMRPYQVKRVELYPPIRRELL